MRVDGQRSCRPCEIAAQQRRRSSPVAGAALVPAGLDVAAYGRRRQWAVRRARYGPTGLSTDGVARLVVPPNPHAGKTHCKRGHRFDAANTGRTKDGRYCRACRRARAAGNRPAWVERDSVRISVEAHDAFYRVEHARRRDAMIAAHPDKTGRRSTAAFIRARRALAAFEQREAAWYAALGLMPPMRTGRLERLAA